MLSFRLFTHANTKDRSRAVRKFLSLGSQKFSSGCTPVESFVLVCVSGLIRRVWVYES